MHTRSLLTLGILLGLGASATSWAAPQPASRFGDELPAPVVLKGGGLASDAFGDPNDFGAALAAGADYLVRAQADVTEDNAGNGSLDSDPDDAGWDWFGVAPVFQHSAATSPKNTMGETAQGLLKAWEIDPQPTYATALADVADYMIAVGPAVVRSASDVIFLLDYAPHAANPAACRSAAQAIWQHHLTTHGSATVFAEALRDERGITQGYPNGIIGWDLGGWAVAVQKLHEALGGYAADADAIAEVMWQDSFNLNPGLFQPANATWRDYDGYAEVRTWWYTLGITGLIDAFAATGTHTEMLPTLQMILLECIYPDGAFSFCYGATPLADDRDWQTTGYALTTLGTRLSGMGDQIADAAHWLASQQDASGAFLYSDNSHYPSVVAQCVAGMAQSSVYMVHQEPLYDHLAVDNGAPHTDQVTTNYRLGAGSLAYRALTVFVDYDPAVLAPVAITPVWSPDPGNDTFQHNLAFSPNGHLEITIAILGPTPGVSGAVPSLFTITWDGLSEDVNPGTAVHIAQVVMRDPLNQDIFCGHGADVEIDVDDSVPTLDATTAALECVNDDFDVDFSAGDNVALDYIEYSLNGGASWLPAVLGLSGPAATPSYTVPVSSMGDGDYSIIFRSWDAVGYVSDPTDPIEFHIDHSAPSAATGLTAMPRDHSVRLTWTAGSELDGYKLFRAKRAAAYPYPAGRPGLSAWPADYTQIDVLGAGVTVYDDDDFPTDTYASRGIYDYVLVSTDCVNADAASTPASATNYFLGDWAIDGSPSPVYGSYDGFVCFPDLQVLGNQYGNLSSAANEEMDVAPTHNMGRFGLPGPDGRLNFEDLIILAMNYRLCGTSPLLQIRRGEEAGRLADAAGLRLAGTGALRQLLPDGSLLGLSAQLQTEAELLSATSTQGTVLFYRTATGWTVDVVGLNELLGSDSVIQLVFDRDAAVSLVSAEGRNESNGVLALTGSTDEAPAQPAVFALSPNHPNPFNPVTTIRYSLATDGPVRIRVFNGLGQQVALLQDGPQSAGAHELSFDGSALASGLYICRLEAQGFTAQQKMMLVK
ncbi:MAG: T9SS type A sorting domain-containing protein [Candidatus Delongbacteria bacterium]